MTPHLTDEQLGATRDGALTGAAAVAADRHLAECAACRERLQELASLDAALAGALEHDPGEEYFGSFADRVAARIASAAPAPRSGLAAWWNSPRRLAWAGGALGVIAVAALVATLAREHGVQELAARAPASRAVTPPAVPQRAASPLAETPSAEPPRFVAPPPAPGGDAGRVEELRAARRSAGAALNAREEAAPSPKAKSENAPAQRVMEVRTLPNGEQEIVTRQPQATPPPAPSITLPNGGSKPAAALLGAQPAMPLQTTQRAAPNLGAMNRMAAPAASRPTPALAPPPAPVAESKVEGAVRVSRDGDATESVSAVAICGQVLDTRGRPAAGALVTVSETGGTASAAADGRFCVDVPESGGTLAVLAVGYRAGTLHVGASNASAPVAITLSAVDVLAPSANVVRRDILGYRGGSAPTAAADPGLARRAAISASAAAVKAATTDAWIVAAERWETVELLEPATSDAEPGFHAAEARVNAWLIGRADPKRAAALRAAARKSTQAYLDHAGDGPALEVARGWYRVLQR